eukprot:CAMPEP_0177637238 /NCGR_PEP_ID=MMETSP0447-20121125/4867_1 /TAXON_ID=0 /ORGANISM="Stygamoeba regulata, Strain BSH-02190019" /LENGTH=898 /DNA_ID=CAMNT_0019139157 /DNA_START=261 /DNA_END=2957 /DNA_ORIENTATION=+
MTDTEIGQHCLRFYPHRRGSLISRLALYLNRLEDAGVRTWQDIRALQPASWAALDIPIIIHFLDDAARKQPEAPSTPSPPVCLSCARDVKFEMNRYAYLWNNNVHDPNNKYTVAVVVDESVDCIRPLAEQAVKEWQNSLGKEWRFIIVNDLLADLHSHSPSEKEVKDWLQAYIRTRVADMGKREQAFAAIERKHGSTQATLWKDLYSKMKSALQDDLYSFLTPPKGQILPERYKYLHGLHTVKGVVPELLVFKKCPDSLPVPLDGCSFTYGSNLFRLGQADRPWYLEAMRVENAPGLLKGGFYDEETVVSGRTLLLPACGCLALSTHSTPLEIFITVQHEIGHALNLHHTFQMAFAGLCYSSMFPGFLWESHPEQNEKYFSASADVDVRPFDSHRGDSKGYWFDGASIMNYAENATPWYLMMLGATFNERAGEGEVRKLEPLLDCEGKAMRQEKTLREWLAGIKKTPEYCNPYHHTSLDHVLLEGQYHTQPALDTALTLFFESIVEGLDGGWPRAIHWASRLWPGQPPQPPDNPVTLYSLQQFESKERAKLLATLAEIEMVIAEEEKTELPNYARGIFSRFTTPSTGDVARVRSCQMFGENGKPLSLMSQMGVGNSGLIPLPNDFAAKGIARNYWEMKMESRGTSFFIVVEEMLLVHFKKAITYLGKANNELAFLIDLPILRVPDNAAEMLKSRMVPDDWKLLVSSDPIPADSWDRWWKFHEDDMKRTRFALGVEDFGITEKDPYNRNILWKGILTMLLISIAKAIRDLALYSKTQLDYDILEIVPLILKAKFRDETVGKIPFAIDEFLQSKRKSSAGAKTVFGIWAQDRVHANHLMTFFATKLFLVMQHAFPAGPCSVLVALPLLQKCWTDDEAFPSMPDLVRIAPLNATEPRDAPQ